MGVTGNTGGGRGGAGGGRGGGRGGGGRAVAEGWQYSNFLVASKMASVKRMPPVLISRIVWGKLTIQAVIFLITVNNTNNHKLNRESLLTGDIKQFLLQ